MLQIIRDKAQGIIIWAIVALVVLGLSSFIWTSYIGGNFKTYVAKVNDQEISQNQFDRAYNRYQITLKQQLGDNFAKFFNSQFAKQAVQASLINSALIQQLTHDAGFRTSKQSILNELENTPAFKSDGKFSSKLYETLLARNGYSTTLYEQQIGQQLAQSQFVDGIKDSAFVVKSQVQDFLRLSRQQRNTAYMLIKTADLRKGIKLDDKEIQAYYDQHKTEFMTQEQVQLAYIDVDTTQLAKSIQVDDADLKAYYKDHKAMYSRDDFSTAEKKIEKIAARARKGESFAKLAKQFSQDPSTAGKGGEFGFISRGQMPKPFEDAAFKLKVGGISKPVRSKYGYQLIKLDGIEQGGQRRKVSYILIKPEKVTESFEQAKQQVRQAVQMQRAEKIYYEDADKLDRLSYEYQDSLDPASEKLGIKIQQSPYISRQGGPGLWHNPDVLKAAFSDDVLKNGLNSDLIKISDKHTLVLRLVNHKPAQQKPLSEVKAQIQAKLISQKASAAALELANKLATSIEKGEKPEKLASANEAASWVDAGYIGRQPQDDAKSDKQIIVSPEIRRDVFEMNKPSDKAVVKAQQLASGDAAVIVLSAVRDNPDKAEVMKLIAKTSQQMTSNVSQAQYKLMLDYERAHSKVEINNKQQESDDNS